MTKTDRTHKFIWAVLILMSILASVKMIVCSFGLDEEYQVVMAYRNMMGDELFYSMWEPHQSSAFLCALLMKPYVTLAGTTGLVLYLRFCGTIFHLGVTLLLYRSIREYIQKPYGVYISLLYYNIIPKQIILPEFGIMQVWFFTAMMCFLLLYAKAEKRRYILFAAFMLVLTILSYPSCLLLFPFVLYVLFHISRSEERWKNICSFTGVCIACGLAYLGLLLSHQSISGLVFSLQAILSGDVTHDLTLLQRISAFVIPFLIEMGFTAGCFLVGALWYFFGKRKNTKSVSIISVAIVCSLCIQFVAWLFINTGYEPLQVHLIVPSIAGIYAYKGMKKNSRAERFDTLIYLGLWGGILSLVCVMMLTDLSLLESIPHGVCASVFGICLFCRYANTIGITEEKISAGRMLYGLLVLWLFVASFGKLYTLRSGTGYHNILQSAGICKAGPCIGTISDYMGAYVYNSDYEDFCANVPDGSKVLIMVDQVMNLDTIQYLFKDVEICHFSVVNPTAYDDRLLAYWEKFPQKTPDVIVVDCWYGNLMTDPDGYLMQYIEKNFGYTEQIDGKYIRIYKKS